LIQVRLVTWTTLRVTPYYLGPHQSGQSWGPTFICHLGVKEKRKAKKEVGERRGEERKGEERKGKERKGRFKEEKEKEEQDEKKRKEKKRKEKKSLLGEGAFG